MTGRGVTTFLRGGLAAALVALLTGCAVGLDRLPLPAPEARGQSYSLVAVFSDALNLPAKAKVRLYGADIGEVDSIRARDFTAHVTLRLRADVPLYSGATAELRAATLLGDVFVQIRPGQERAPDAVQLRDGDTIPLQATTAAPNIEELLDSMALLVNGGAVRHMVALVNGGGRAVGGSGEKLGSLLDTTSELLTRLTSRSDQLSNALAETSALAAEMAARRDTFDEALTHAAPALAVIADNTTRLADLTTSISRITRQLARFPSVQGVDTRSLTADLNRLAEVFNDISVDPALSLNAFNRLIGVFMRITNSTGAHAALNLAKLSLAPWPDKNYPGDPGFHWPDGTDYHQIVGSLRYEWNMLLNQIYGAQRWNPAAPP